VFHFFNFSRAFLDFNTEYVMKKKKKSDLMSRFIFLAVMIAITVVTFFINPDKTVFAIKYGFKILLIILPIMLIVLLIMTIIDFFLKEEKISNLLGAKSGLKGFSIAAFAGIISHGPIFAWYPMLDSLRKKGMSLGLVAVFLYTRAIKLPLVPLLVLYFGWNFILIWFLYLVLASFLVGRIIDWQSIKV
jgi:uncharacterized membrane protein YraQ (UPF0718 family)